MEKTFIYNGEKYILTYTLDVIRTMEANGFVLENLTTQGATNIPLLVYGAFMENHKRLKREEIDKIYKALPKKQEFIKMLIEMYNDAFRQLIDDPDENQGNLVTEICW